MANRPVPAGQATSAPLRTRPHEPEISTVVGKARAIPETPCGAPMRVRDDAAVIQVSVRPAPRAVPRSALATAEIMAAATAVHAWAGGAVPAVPWLVGVTGLVFGASLLVIRDLAPLRWMVPGLAAAQLLLHGLLALMAPSAGHAHGHGTGGALLDLSWQMLAAHAASGAITALVWHLRRRLLEAIIHWPRRLRAMPIPRLGLRPMSDPWVPSQRAWLLAAPRRGPPARLRCA